MKTGKVLIPFQDGTTGTAYKINNEFKGSSKRFEELLKAGLISESKEDSDKESKKSNKKSVETNSKNEEDSDNKEDSKNEENSK